MKTKITLIIGCLILSINLSIAQKMTLCDCITHSALMIEEELNGLSDEDYIKKYETNELECTKLMESLSETELMGMYECKDFEKYSSLYNELMMKNSNFDIEIVCGCVDLMSDAYGNLLNEDVDEDTWTEKYAEKIAMCEPIFMDEAALGMIMNCENFTKLNEILMQLMGSE